MTTLPTTTNSQPPAPATLKKFDRQPGPKGKGKGAARDKQRNLPQKEVEKEKVTDIKTKNKKQEVKTDQVTTSCLQNALVLSPQAIRDSANWKFYVNLGLIPTEQEGSNTNPHARGATLRTLLTARIFGRMVEVHNSQNPVKCISLWGAQRDFTLVSKINRNVARPLELVCYRPTVTPADVTRVGPSLMLTTVDDIPIGNDFIFLMDVYKSTEPYGQGDLSPDTICRIILRSQLRAQQAQLIWVGRNFETGCGTCEGEAAWFNENGIVSFKPDGRQSGYSHGACSWIWTTNSHNYVDERGQDHHLYWSEFMTLSSFKVILFTLTQRELIPEPLLADFESQTSILDLNTTRRFNFSWTPSFLRSSFVKINDSFIRYFPFLARTLYGTVKLRAYYPIVRKMIDLYAVAQKNSLSYRRIYNDMLQSMREDQDYILINNSFPHYFTRDLPALALGIMNDDIDSKAGLVRDLLRNEREKMESYNDDTGINMVKNREEEVSSTPSILVGLCVAGFQFFVAPWLMRKAYTWWRGAPHPTWKDYLPLPGSFAVPKMFTFTKTVTVSTSYRDPFTDVAFVVDDICDEPITWHYAFVRKIQQVVTPLFSKIKEKIFPYFLDLKKRASWTSEILTWGAKRYYTGTKASLEADFQLSNMMRVHNCFIAPFYEEYIKRFHPSLAVFLPFFEFALNVHNVGLWAALPTLTMHYLALCGPYNFGVAVHILWNVLATNYSALVTMWVHIMTNGVPKKARRSSSPTTGCFYEAFRRKFYYEPWENREIEDEPERHSQFDPALGATPCSQEACYDAVVACPDLEVRGRWLPGAPKNPTHFWWLIPTSIPGYVPAASDAMLLAAVDARILVAPPLDPMQQKKAWETLEREVLPKGMFPKCSTIYWDFSHTGWMDHFVGLKKRKYQFLMDQLQNEGVHQYAKKARKTGIFVKSNELLMKIKGTRMQLKPRVIINVHPQVQTLLGPCIYAAQQRLKNIWNVNPDFLQLKQWKYRLTYAGAFTDYDLSEWRRHANDQTAGVVSIIVSGDDSCVDLAINGVRVVFEGDASMYDQSQSFGPLGFERRRLLELGVDRGTCKILKILAANNYEMIRKDREKIMLIGKSDRPLRDTGGPDTSLGNSINMAAAWILVLETVSSLDLEALRARFLFLGFDMKIKKVDPLQATFLKGMWYETDCGPYWGPLPSRALKYGKCLRDPRSLYHTKDLLLAAKYFLNDLSVSYGYYLQVPILRVMVTATRTDGRLRRIHDDWVMISAEKSPKPRLLPEAFMQVKLHYELLDGELEALETLCTHAGPFVFLQSPTWIKLAKRDYN